MYKVCEIEVTKGTVYIYLCLCVCVCVCVPVCLCASQLTCQLTRLEMFSTRRRYSVLVGGPYLHIAQNNINIHVHAYVNHENTQTHSAPHVSVLVSLPHKHCDNIHMVIPLKHSKQGNWASRTSTCLHVPPSKKLNS